MTREIKFRAWDTVNYKFQEIDSITISRNDKPCNINNHYQILDGRIGQIILSQFTGLKDKNGKEIYEGDIFSWGVHRGIVEMKKGSWMFTELLGVDHQGETIGNIYENPELLK